MGFSVLMVCTGNICRSPMAEGILRHLLPDALKTGVSVRSAGTHGLHGNLAEPFAVRAAAAVGADISDHRARILDATMVKTADLVLAMERYHLDQINRFCFFRCKNARLLGDFAADWQDPEIVDPYGEPYPAYESTAASILACIPGLIEHLHRQTQLNAS